MFVLPSFSNLSACNCSLTRSAGKKKWINITNFCYITILFFYLSIFAFISIFSAFIADDWHRVLVENSNWFKSEENVKADLSKKANADLCKNTMTFGIEGSFRKIAIDWFYDLPNNFFFLRMRVFIVLF